METSLEPTYKAKEVHDCGRYETKLSKHDQVLSCQPVLIYIYWSVVIDPQWYYKWKNNHPS